MASEMDCSIEDTSILRNLILENPELPVLIFVGDEAYTGEYGYNQADASNGEIENLTIYDNYWLNEDDYREKLTNDLADADAYKDLSDKDFKQIIDKKVKETEFVKAIVIHVG